MQEHTQFKKGDYVMYTNTNGTAQNIAIVMGGVSSCYPDRNQCSVQLVAKRVDMYSPFVRRGKLPIIVNPGTLHKINPNDYAYVLRPPLNVGTQVWYYGEGGIEGGIKHYGHIVREHTPSPYEIVPRERFFIVELYTTKYPYHQDFRTPIDRFVSCCESQLHEDFVIW